MELMTRIDIPKPGWKMKTGATVLLVGSCFAEEVGRKMRRGGFDVMVNPFGTLYNPASIAVCLDSALSATGDFSVDEKVKRVEKNYKEMDQCFLIPQIHSDKPRIFQIDLINLK